MAWRIIVCVLAGYLLGNLNGAIITSKLFHHEDVRDKGSGNAGLTNFFRSYGGVETLLVIVIDAGKSILACYVGLWLFQGFEPGFVHVAEMIGGGMAVLGHIFPVMWSLRGGKGIMTCAGIALFFGIAHGIWWIFLVCLGVFLIAVVLTKWVSLGSICDAIAFPISMWIFMPEEPSKLYTVLIAAALGLLAIIMHRGNIVRIFKGTERKLSFHKKGSK